MVRAIALLLTVATGFSGLAYEVAWERYLAALLGSHSEATASVLGIFLGGLALGYSLFGRLTRALLERGRRAGRPPRLLLAYGLVEAAIGVYVLCFPWLFRAAQVLSLSVPHGAAGVGFAFDVGVAALLIGPPTVLMGGTIPILTQALARGLHDATRFHALVYAFNTAGAFAGALAAGFVLIPALGLVGIMRAMGTINLIAGGTFVLLGRRAQRVAASGDASAPAARPAGWAGYAAVALLTGFAMMAVQTTLIRLGSLSFGASQFTFSNVVAVFVLCIALGSFGVSAFSRIPRALILVNQCALVLLLFLLHDRLAEAPFWARRLRDAFPNTDAAFYPYQLAALLAMLGAIGLPVILSGASLPLLFHHLRRQMGELGSVAGELYSWNTVGSLLGALLGGYALLFWLDLHHVYRIALGALIVSVAVLGVRLYPVSPAVAAVLLVPALGSVVWLDPWDPRLLSSGLFRRRPELGALGGSPEEWLRQNRAWSEILLYDDDPTASVAVKQVSIGGADQAVSRGIYTNGKSDGSTIGDYPTMALAGLLPALFAEHARRAFVIGFGTGVTAGELAALRETEEVVVAEISPGVIRAAPLFDAANQDVSHSSKLRVIRSDAYRALLRDSGRYDAIVSEPSNPWVVGVEMLFSREFLAAARSRLTPRGVYAQWFHVYESDTDLIALVLRTYASVFDHVAVWYCARADLLLLGFNDASLALDAERLEERAARPDFRAGLERAGVDGFGALLAHELLPLGVVHDAIPDGPVHTLLQPLLNHRAGRAFFRGQDAPMPFTGFGAAARVGARNSLLRRYAERRFAGELPDALLAPVTEELCQDIMPHCTTFLAHWWRRDARSPRLRELMQTIRKRSPRARLLDPDYLRAVADLLPGDSLPVPEPVSVATARRATRLYAGYYHHSLPFEAGRLLGTWERCEPGPRSARACENGLAAARALLGGGSDRRRGGPDPGDPDGAAPGG